MNQCTVCGDKVSQGITVCNGCSWDSASLLVNESDQVTNIKNIQNNEKNIHGSILSFS